MKYLLFSAMLTVSIAAHAQDSAVQKLVVSMCPCATALDPKTGFGSKALGQCYLDAVNANMPYIAALAQTENGDSANAKMQDFMHNLFGRTIFNAPYFCDAFIKMADSSHFYFRYSGNRDSVKKVIANYNKMDRKLSGNFFYFRGNAYMLLFDFKHAMADADSAVITKPKDRRSWELKEWALEANNRFDEALEACHQLMADYPTDRALQMLPAIILRKKQLYQGK